MKRTLCALLIALGLPTVASTQQTPQSGAVWLMVVHEVADYGRWRAIFDSGYEARRIAGELQFEINTYPQQPNRIIAVFEWDSATRACAFLSDQALKNAMAAAGVISPPVVTFRDGAMTCTDR